MTAFKRNGKWEFLECDGRSNKCAQDGGVVPNINPLETDQRCKNCVEWCRTKALAIDAINEWYKQHPEVEE